jgi:hypothetical protein
MALREVGSGGRPDPPLECASPPAAGQRLPVMYRCGHRPRPALAVPPKYGKVGYAFMIELQRLGSNLPSDLGVAASPMARWLGQLELRAQLPLTGGYWWGLLERPGAEKPAERRAANDRR